MFLSDYTLRVILSDCNPSSQKVNALVDLSADISEVLPFLNTVPKGRQYNHEEGSLTVKRGGHFITFWAAPNCSYKTGGTKPRPG